MISRIIVIIQFLVLHLRGYGGHGNAHDNQWNHHSTHMHDVVTGEDQKHQYTDENDSTQSDCNLNYGVVNFFF
jgi:hypothetical protein